MNNSQDNSVFSAKFKVSCYDVDKNKRLKISALMRFQQEVGERHTNKWNVSYETMHDEMGVVFIIVRSSINITRFPKMEDDVVMTTWCSGVKGATFIRNYRLTDIDGGLLAESISYVVAADKTSHRPVNPRKIDGFSVFQYSSEEKNNCDPPIKVEKLIKNADLQREIRFSDIDYNGHLNNTVYADIVVDSLDTKTQEMAIKKTNICFLGEAKLGDVIDISVEKTNEKTAIISGTNDNSLCFTAMVETF